MVRHILRMLPVLMIAVATSVRADFVYTFQTTQAAQGAGAVGGSLTVFDDAVQSGFITASDVDLYAFFLLDATAPFIPGPFDSANSSISLFGNGPIVVDKQTGEFLYGDIVIVLTNLASQEQLQFQAAMFSQYSVQTSGNVNANGLGTWAVERVGVVPEPTSLVLSGLGLAAILGVCVPKRCRR